MNVQPTHALMPYLLLAEFGAALFAGSAASADERITLEAIGAVRMAGSEEVRRVDGPHRRTEARPAHDAVVERTEAGTPSHRN
ncbi:hypothetical protein OPKNFCMD_4494 [Methylobacterium crusticola]|uniref:Porin n=1 Tax=Methylobacterium crusticola TaxID=1697972 RepID=A0ABQ4R2T1_9HYPH|nr:hypothetical protein [Methylobacterium crusticola]GJD51737.1 hypothetical protein OPKNFCMD_4494 [Methylobacterium crusticola]